MIKLDDEGPEEEGEEKVEKPISVE